MADTEQCTVRIEKVEGYNAVKMMWCHHVLPVDVEVAFRKLKAALDETDVPLYIIVDLHMKPRFPISVTIDAALKGTFTHPRIAEWLVVGANRSAHIIGSVLSNTTGRKNIRWFDTEEEAIASLKERD